MSARAFERTMFQPWKDFEEPYMCECCECGAATMYPMHLYKMMVEHWAEEDPVIGLCASSTYSDVVKVMQALKGIAMREVQAGRAFKLHKLVSVKQKQVKKKNGSVHTSVAVTACTHLQRAVRVRPLFLHCQVPSTPTAVSTSFTKAIVLECVQRARRVMCTC